MVPLLQSAWPMITSSPTALPCYCCTSVSLESTGQALHQHAYVCPEPAALVLFTQWIAPVSYFLERG